MSGSTGMRRAVAEVRWDNDPGMISWVGNRPVHQYWPMISSYFRDLLLPPHRRADENVVTWTWQEPSHPEPLIPSELRGLRRRLESEQQLFLENLVRAGAGNGGVGPKGQVNVDELGSVMGQVVGQLVSCTDADLATFLCRTDHGLRIHSWGAVKAASPRFPDTKGLEISGRVMVGGKPGLHDVILESGDGEHLAETPSDATGAFHFPKLVPGKYRLRARSTRGTFPPNGLAVVLNRTSVTDIILADRDAPVAPTPRGRRSRRSGSRVALFAVGGGLALLIAGGAWFWLDRAPNAAMPQVEAPVANVEKAATHVARAGEIRPSAVGTPVAPLASETRAGAMATVGRERDLTGRVTAVKPVALSSDDPRKSAPRDPFDATRDPGDDHRSRQAGPRPDPAGLARNAGGGSAEAAGITPSSATSTPAATGSPNPAGAASASDANLAASPAPGAGTLAAAAGNGVKASEPASPTDSLSPTAANPGSSPMASPAPSSAPPTAQPSLPNGAVVTPPQPEADLPTKADLAATKAAQDVQTSASAESIVADNPAADGKDPSKDSNAKAKVKETAAKVSQHDRESDERMDEQDRRALAQRADREREASNRALPESFTTGPRVARLSTLQLTRTMRVRLTPWRLQLLEDTILPTRPLRAGQVETVSAMRQRLLAEQQARLPATLRESEVVNGVVLALPPEQSGEVLVWRDHTGAVASNSRVQNGRAEIIWTAENAPVENPVRLMRANGEILAEVRQEAATRELVIRTAEEVRAWLRWVVRASVTENELGSGGSETNGDLPRFSWRTSTGGPLPPGWEAGMEGVGADHRLDLPIGGAMGSVALHRYALFDRVSGWALVAELRQAADRPLSE